MYVMYYVLYVALIIVVAVLLLLLFVVCVVIAVTDLLFCIQRLLGKRNDSIDRRTDSPFQSVK